MKRNRLAIVALLLGIMSFINLFGLEKGIMAIVAGWMAILEIKEEPSFKGKGMAWAGIVLGAFSITMITLLVIWKGPQIFEFLKNLPNPK
jgi:hypothetical protein